jgi:hypothetical protein
MAIPYQRSRWALLPALGVLAAWSGPARAADKLYDYDPDKMGCKFGSDYREGNDREPSVIRGNCVWRVDRDSDQRSMTLSFPINDRTRFLVIEADAYCVVLRAGEAQRSGPVRVTFGKGEISEGVTVKDVLKSSRNLAGLLLTNNEVAERHVSEMLSRLGGEDAKECANTPGHRWVLSYRSAGLPEVTKFLSPVDPYVKDWNGYNGCEYLDPKQNDVVIQMKTCGPQIPSGLVCLSRVSCYQAGRRVDSEAYCGAEVVEGKWRCPTGVAKGADGVVADGATRCVNDPRVEGSKADKLRWLSGGGGAGNGGAGAVGAGNEGGAR